jgi:argininosuccinate lyase
MPQKRNPVALEHARAIASKALGQASAIVTSVHNTPFGDVVDTEDDLQPLVFSMFKDATRAVKLVAAALRDADFDRERMAVRARQNWITVTELADTLARERGLSFRTAHGIAARFVTEQSAEPSMASSTILDRVARDVTGAPIGWSESELERLLSPTHFVEVRRTPGGPAPDVTARAIAASRERLAADDSSWQRAMNRLKEAEERLRSASDAL